MDESSRKQTILAAAEDLFSRYGYEKTTIEDITERLHLSKTAVYYYFKGKEEILRNVLEKEFEAARNKLDSLRVMVDGRLIFGLERYLRARVPVLLEAPVYRKYLVGSLNHTGGGEAVRIAAEVRGKFDQWEYDYFYDIAKRCTDAGFFSSNVKPSVFAQMLPKVLKGLEMQIALSDTPEELQGTYNEVLSILLRGLYPHAALNRDQI